MEPEIYYCGELIALEGLEPIAHLLRLCSWPIQLVRSGCDGTSYLRAHNDIIDLDMDSGQTSHFLFSGTVVGFKERAKQLLGEFSTLLSGDEVVHRLELYRGSPAGEKVGYFHYGWPEGLS